ncbi:hypothetical protein C1H46_018502 [Malus baccata]|uniref:Histidine kinase domain-containing protein n=1 Tax=Malus baccata TaxID=106549 RepID=A0A540MAT3_MALBA|nr:hypothetical protein C1H46_018502 [Malus baccata]
MVQLAAFDPFESALDALNQCNSVSEAARLRQHAGKHIPGEVVAVRVPLLHLSNFQINDWPELSTKRYSLMVLMLPSDSARQWHVHELELVEVVAHQVVMNFSWNQVQTKLAYPNQASGCYVGSSSCIAFPGISLAVKVVAGKADIAADLSVYAIGDEKRLMPIILNVVGNAVKFSKEGSISITAYVAKSESLRDFRAPDFFPVQSDNHFYPRVQVKDSGSGINPQDIPNLFTKFPQTQTLASQNSGGSGLGLAICKRPGIDGYELAVCIHEKFTKRHERPVLVALTGSIDKMTKENCMRRQEHYSSRGKISRENGKLKASSSDCGIAYTERGVVAHNKARAMGDHGAGL